MQIFSRFAAPNDAPSVAAPLGTRFGRRAPGGESLDSSPPRTLAASHRFGAAISAPAPTRRAISQFVRAALGAGALMASLMLGSGDARAQSDVTSPGDTITFSGGGSSGSQGPASAIDNNVNTKYLNSFQVNSLTIRPSRGATVLTGVRFATANDAPERDPTFVSLFGSNDGTNFTSITGTSTGLSPVSTRNTFGLAQTFTNTNVYTFYRLDFGGIRDNSTQSALQFSEVELLGTFGPFYAINNISQAEGNSGTSNFVFTVSRGGDVSGASSVSYSVSGGTTNAATAGTDFGTAFDSDGATPGVLNFAANATTGTVSVPVIGDTDAEANETFLVTLSNPSSGAITTNTSAGTGVGLGTITNDDAAVNNSVAGSKVYFTTLGTPTTSDTLGRVNPDATGGQAVASGASAFNNAVGVAVDSVGGFVYVAENTTNARQVLRFNLDGTNRTAIYTSSIQSGGNGLRDVVFAPTTRQLYVLDSYGVVRLNPDGSGVTQVTPNTTGINGQPAALAVDVTRGYIYFANPSTSLYPSDAIIRTNLDGGGLIALISKQDYVGSTNAPILNSLYLDTDTGDVYGTAYTGTSATDANNGNGRVVRFNSSGAVTVLLTNLPAPDAVAIDKANGYLYEGERGYGAFNPPTYARINRYSFATLSGRTQLASLDAAASGTATVQVGGIAVYVPPAPTVTTPTSTNITQTSATLGGNVTSDGGAAITERGVVYAPTATNSNPLIGGTGVLKATASGTTGVFTVAVTGLMASTGYSFKAYATNANGTSYTSVATFSTLAPPPNAAPVFGNSTYNFIFTQNRAISGARVSASDADGDALTYALTGGALPAGVTFNADGTFSGTPSATSTLITRTVSVSDGKGGSASASVTIQVSAETGVIISEFRFRGKSGALDEYVELYNKRGGPLNISGWSIQTRTATGLQTTVVPANKIIPPFGRYLFTGSVFSLTSYGTSDQTIAADVVNASGVALFNAAGTVQDAVGFTTSDAALKEGAGLLSAPTSNGEYAFVRDTTGTLPKDTADSTQDFVFVIADADATTPAALATVSGTGGNVIGRLGAPSPEGIADPAYANPIIAGALLDPNVSQSAAPNRERVGFVPNTSLGDLLIRRTITNNSGRPITKLRFSVASITSLGTPGPAGQADVRLVSSTDGSVTIGGVSVPVKGLTLETGATGQPALPLGGGLGSSAVLGEVSMATPLANGASRSVVFRLQILKSGNFSVLFNFHAAPGS